MPKQDLAWWRDSTIKTPTDLLFVLRTLGGSGAVTRTESPIRSDQGNILSSASMNECMMDVSRVSPLKTLLAWANGMRVSKIPFTFCFRSKPK